MVHEGRFTLIRGKQRAGKTLLMSILAHNNHTNKRTIYTNIEYSFPHTPLYFRELDLNDPNIISLIRNSCITLDEIWMLLDARSSMSSPSKKFSRWLYQVKKQGVDLYGTTHEVSLIDRRARENFDWLIDVQCYWYDPQKNKLLPKRPPNVESKPLVMLLEIQNGPLQSTYHATKKLILQPSFFGLYDTGNVFDPLEPPPDYQPKSPKPENKQTPKKGKKRGDTSNGYLSSAPYRDIAYSPSSTRPFDW